MLMILSPGIDRALWLIGLTSGALNSNAGLYIVLINVPECWCRKLCQQVYPATAVFDVMVLERKFREGGGSVDIQAALYLDQYLLAERGNDEVLLSPILQENGRASSCQAKGASPRTIPCSDRDAGRAGRRKAKQMVSSHSLIREDCGTEPWRQRTLARPSLDR